MHPRIAGLVTYLEQSRAALLASIEGRTVEELEQRPEPEAWSALEILDHLSLVERRVAGLLTSMEGRARQLGPERSTQSVLGSLDALALTTVTRPVQTPTAARPRGHLSLSDAIAELQGTRAQLLAAMKALDGLALEEIAASHPILGELNLYQWMLFVGHHEVRHTSQIRRALSRAALAPP